MFHKNCFNCVQCRQILGLANFYTGSDSEIYCRTCYLHKFFIGGRNCYLDYSNMVESEDTSGDRCPRCLIHVFEAEGIVTRYGKYHGKCLSCSDCKRLLNSSNFLEAKDRKIYCKACCAVKHGRLDQKVSVEMTFFLASGDDLKCMGCDGKVFEAEKMLTQFGAFHPACFKCNDCSRVFDAIQAFRFR